MTENLSSEKGSKIATSISLRFCPTTGDHFLDRFLASIAIPFHLNRVPTNWLLTSRTEIVPNCGSDLSLSEEKEPYEETGRHAHSETDQTKDEPG